MQGTLNKNKLVYQNLLQSPDLYAGKPISIKLLEKDEDWEANDRIVVIILCIFISKDESEAIEIGFIPIKRSNVRNYSNLTITSNGEAYISADSFDSNNVEVTL